MDVFGLDCFNIAKEFGDPPYVFFPMTAMVLSLIFYSPKLDETCSCECRDLHEPIKIPGCGPVHGIDLVDALHDRKSESYKWAIHTTKRFSLASGIIVNSSMDLEPVAFDALKEKSAAW